MKTLEEMEARAQRRLDGMTVNMDELAKDVLQLVMCIRVAKQHIARLTAEPQNAKSDGFAESFQGLFDDIFKSNSNSDRNDGAKKT